jgi:hypothetical protein
MRSAARACATLALAAVLGGCVAVAALPVLAGSAMIAGGNVRIRAATPRPAPVRMTDGGAAAEMTAGTSVVLTALTALPEPGPCDRTGPDPWRLFVDYALERAARPPGDGKRRSVLLEAGTSLDLPRTRACEAKIPAVIIDLDPETRPFIAAAAKPPARELVAGLARLREAGVAVAWITALPAAYVTEVAEALRASGLDPAGADALLLARNREDRKQVLRVEAGRDVCVIAMAGDRRGDFDELFDYLRDPAMAASFDSLLGAGWFLVPPPLG